MSTVTVADVKTRLNKTLSVDDTEIQAMIDAAEAEFIQWVGPITGSVTDKLDGGSSQVVLRHTNAGALTAAAYTDGTTITLTDLDLDTATGIVYWNYGTAGYFTPGCRNVSITYTVATLSANYKEAIIADVAGYFEMTQEGPAGPDDGYATGNRSTPLVLFPRIRALALPGFA